MGHYTAEMDGSGPRPDQQPTARNCKNWKRYADQLGLGVCDRCGVQWQYMEVSADYKCPHFERQS